MLSNKFNLYGENSSLSCLLSGNILACLGYKDQIILENKQSSHRYACFPLFFYWTIIYKGSQCNLMIHVTIEKEGGGRTFKPHPFGSFNALLVYQRKRK
jgi:hypothetical protein